MLRLTKKADYGLMALKFLAEHPNEASLSAKDIGAFALTRRDERRLYAGTQSTQYQRF